MKNRRTNNRPNNEPKIEYTAIYKVNRSDELLEFLLKKCNTSRNNVKHLLSNRMVLVNGNVITQFNFIVAKDDEIKISKKPLREEAKANSPRREKKKFYTFNILYEDSDFIAIDKPQGLLSVESDKESECAYSYVMQYLQQKSPNLRAFQLHRIDKETSGVLLFTKNVKIHSILKLNWNEYVKAREYYAVIEGHLKEKEGRHESYLLENQNNMVYSSKNPAGQKTVTDYKVIKESNAYSLVKVNILTGRKNQIRVHMQDMGCPIVGDTKYGHTKDPLKRLGLHASRLEIINPLNNEVISISAPLPGTFRSLFDKK